MKIKTDHKWKEFIYGYQLPEKFKSDFDYIDSADIDSHEFIKYKGYYYDPGDFMRMESTIAPHPQREGWEEWHGYQSDSFFSGVLIKLSDDGEQYQVATYFS